MKTSVTCKAGIGGPLFDFDGKFLGMNFYDKYAGGTPYLTWEAIRDVLGYFEKKRYAYFFLGIQVLVMWCNLVSRTYIQELCKQSIAGSVEHNK